MSGKVLMSWEFLKGSWEGWGGKKELDMEKITREDVEFWTNEILLKVGYMPKDFDLFMWVEKEGVYAERVSIAEGAILRVLFSFV